MSHTVAVDLLPSGVTSYDLWEAMIKEGLEPIVIVTANERYRAPRGLHFEFPSAQEAVRAISLIRERTARSDFHALAS